MAMVGKLEHKLKVNNYIHVEEQYAKQCPKKHRAYTIENETYESRSRFYVIIYHVCVQTCDYVMYEPRGFSPLDVCRCVAYCPIRQD